MCHGRLNLFLLSGIFAGSMLGCAPSGSEVATPNNSTEIFTKQDSSSTDSKPTNSESASTASSSSADKQPSSDSTTDAKSDASVSVVDMNFDKIQAFIQSKKGSVVVVDMWATWCPPCVKEFPNLVTLHNRYASSDVVCISLSFDHQGIDPIEETRATVLEFLKSNRATMTNILATDESDALSTKFQIASIPVVDVYDREGNRVQRFDSSSSPSHEVYAEVNKLVETLVAKGK